MDITYDDEKHLRDHYTKNIQETTTQYLNLNISDWSIPHWNVKYKWIVFSEHNETASNHYDKQWSYIRQHLITIFLHLVYIGDFVLSPFLRYPLV